jgi:CO/xanthine dehydrogenase FAD-binding subunit
VIPYNFDYYKPCSISEAVGVFAELQSIEKQPLYYNGGTEIITFARMNSIHTDAVIDIKGIPECNVFQMDKEYLIIGSSVTLSEIVDSNYYPLLGKVSREIADRTARNKITLGGNICGKIQYREAVLPLLISDAYIVVTGDEGIRKYNIKDIFEGSPKLKKDEFIVQILIPIENLSLPFFNIKRRRNTAIGYPLISAAAVKKDKKIRVALSGVTTFPFRDIGMEEEINKSYLPPEIRAKNAIEVMPYKIKEDLYSSAEYREHLLQNALVKIIENLEDAYDSI